ncbi:hypothetical protein K8O68_16605 [Salipaludibacillus sp. CUR1]|uniref:hypothetical protein n=1 Tax=Salipaludibacillus sp. CUR1 TaxID=2820003 RepID=UPI001E4BBAD3|nr:hypothetical protein [Salipaludibacillus sp. CUR1]MCE7794010.1 hypothetical protein [Salipaludibacillus sp. CUR1]
MKKSQEKLLELMVDRVFAKHGVEEEADISVKDRKKLREVVDQLTEEANAFLENSRKQVTEGNTGNTEKKESRSSVPTEPSPQTEPKRKSRIIRRSKNDTRNIKTYLP